MSNVWVEGLDYEGMIDGPLDEAIGRTEDFHLRLGDDRLPEMRRPPRSRRPRRRWPDGATRRPSRPANATATGRPCAPSLLSRPTTIDGLRPSPDRSGPAPRSREAKTRPLKAAVTLRSRRCSNSSNKKLGRGRGLRRNEPPPRRGASFSIRIGLLRKALARRKRIEGQRAGFGAPSLQQEDLAFDSLEHLPVHCPHRRCPGQTSLGRKAATETVLRL